MKKLVFLAAVSAAMVLMAAAPAVAQVSQKTEQGVESGTATQNFAISGGGDSASRCAEILGAAQTGNAANSTGTLQADGGDSEIEVDDSGSLTISPALAEKCEQKINQAAASASAPKAAPAPKVEEKKAEEKKAEEKKAEEKKAEEKKAEEKKAEATQAKAEAKTGEKKELPKTGGDDSELFVLGIGALLVAGGLLAYSIIR